MRHIASWTIILIATVTATTGCDSPTQRTEVFVPDHPSGPHFAWYQTLEDGADYLLVTKLTIPNFFNEHVQEIRIRRYMSVDANGDIQSLPDALFGSEHADGSNEKGGLGYGGAINVVDSISDIPKDDESTILDVYYYWTTQDQVEGNLREQFTVKVGVPVDISFKNGCRLSIRWQKLT